MLYLGTILEIPARSSIGRILVSKIGDGGSSPPGRAMRVIIRSPQEVRSDV